MDYNYSNCPLFRPLDYYKDVKGNNELAVSHYLVRTKDEDLSNYNYITMMPPAEMSRYMFFVVVENTNKKTVKIGDFYSANKKINRKIHKDQIVGELRAMFNKFDTSDIPAG